MLGFAAVNTGNNLLFLVVAGLLAFMSVTGFAGMMNLRKLTVEIDPPAELYAGAAAPFTIRIKNGKQRFPSFLLAVDSPGSADTAARIPMIEPNGEGMGTAFLSFPHRGMSDIGSIRITSPFPVGFFFRFCTLPVARRVLVFPRLIPCAAAPASASRGKSGENNLAARGMDGELERISPYSGAEPLKMIHWKISARSEELMVKGFGALAGEPLVIDLRVLPPRDREEKISCAAWMVRRWVETRPVGLRFGDKSFAPATGRRHGARLLTELALVGDHGDTPP